MDVAATAPVVAFVISEERLRELADRERFEAHWGNGKIWFGPTTKHPKQGAGRWRDANFIASLNVR